MRPWPWRRAWELTVRTGLGIVLPCLCWLAWQRATASGNVPADVLPSPEDCWAAFAQIVQDGTLASDLTITTWRVCCGFAMGASLGVVIGCVVGLSRWAAWLFDPLIQGIRAVPSLAWIPLFILWMGIGEASKITLIALGVFFPVYINTCAGVRDCDRKLIELARVYGLSRWAILWRIVLPFALPAIFTGLRTGAGLGWMFVVAAELMGSSAGLGYLLVYGQNTYSVALILVSIVSFAVLGALTSLLLGSIGKWLFRWQDTLGNRTL